MGKFTQILVKEGETVQRYAHSFTSRDGTTNLKESQWANAINVTAIVRSQPERTIETPLGVFEGEGLVLLTETALSEYDVILWQSKYFDVVMVEAMYFRKTFEHYRATCIRRIEFLGN